MGFFLPPVDVIFFSKSVSLDVLTSRIEEKNLKNNALKLCRALEICSIDFLKRLTCSRSSINLATKTTGSPGGCYYLLVHVNTLFFTAGFEQLARVTLYHIVDQTVQAFFLAERR